MSIRTSPYEAIQGVAIFSDSASSRTIEQIGVRPDNQGGGIGSALIEEIEGDAALIGISILELETVEFMSDLIRFYDKHGFDEVRRGPPKHGNDEFTRVFLRKIIWKLMQSRKSGHCSKTS